MINRLGNLKELIKLKYQLNMLHWINLFLDNRKQNTLLIIMKNTLNYSKAYCDLFFFVVVKC